jgi:hypothetical protein
MSKYLRGAFGTADSRDDFQSFVSDLKYAASVAADDEDEVAVLKASVATTTSAARGSLPRNKFFAAGRGPNIADLKKTVASSTGKAKLKALITEWTLAPFDARKYDAIVEFLPKAGNSEFAALVKEIMLVGGGVPTVHHSMTTGCWTMNFSEERRAVIDAALIEARRVLNLMTTTPFNKAPVEDVFDAYFGFWASTDEPIVSQVKGVFNAVSKDMLGTNRCRLVMAPPSRRAGPRGTGRDTLAYVRSDTFPKEKGAMIFLGEAFFGRGKTVADRAATLIHEGTHYFAGTVDKDELGSESHCYGMADCKRLANLADEDLRKKAVLHNADTYCLFAQEAADAL